MEKATFSSGEMLLLFERNLLYHVSAIKEHRKANKYLHCL